MSNKKLLFLLIPLAILFAYIWIKANEPNIKNAILITKEGQKNIEYPFNELGLKKGEPYNIIFYIKTGIDYSVHFADSLRSMEIGTWEIPADGTPVSYSKNITLNFSTYPLEPEFRWVRFNMTSMGVEIPFNIEVLHISDFRSLPFSMSIAIITLLLIVFLQLNANYFGKSGIWIFRIIIFGLACYAFAEFCGRIAYELSGAVNIYDGSIFLAMGRGIANGLKYYTDLDEIKPPGYYYTLSWLFHIFKTNEAVHWFQAFVLAGIAALPTLFYLKHYSTPSQTASNNTIPYLSITILFGLLLALYSGERAGELEIESFGAFFGSIAVFAFASSDFLNKKKIYIALVVIGFLGSCGFKEPFFFPLLGVSFLFSKNIKEWWWKFGLPLLITIVLSAIFLFANDLLSGYLHYFFYMSGTYTGAVGSPFERMWKIWYLWADLERYSFGFGILFIFIMLFTLIKKEGRIRLIWALPLGVILSCLAAGMGSGSVARNGFFFNHHHIFAVPFYLALLFLFLQRCKDLNIRLQSFISAIICALLALITLNLPDAQWELRLKSNLEWQKPMKLEALYLDAVLEKSGVDRYMIIGDAGRQAFGYTHYSPQGPLLIWWPTAWQLDSEWFDKYFEQLAKSQIVVFQNVNKFPKDERNKMLKILENEFTPVPWESIADIPQVTENGKLRSSILFRKDKFSD